MAKINPVQDVAVSGSFLYVWPPPIRGPSHSLCPSPSVTLPIGFVNATKEQLGTVFSETAQDFFHPYPHRDHVTNKSRDHGAIAG